MSHRDHLLIPEVLVFSVQENWGGGADTSENLILEEKLDKKGGGKGL